MSTEKIYRNFQLRVMGIIALALPPLAIILVMLVHGLPAPESISQTATIAARTDFLLPLCLGALALFSLTYSLKYSYADKLDKILTAIMCGGFLMVAMQICESDYITAERIGMFGVPQSISHIMHCIGAVSGFGSMIFWVMLSFPRSDKPRNKQTVQKRIRNSIYYWLGWGMIGSLLIFIVNIIGFFGADFPVVFVVEWVMLGFGGLACLLKGGLFLSDREVSDGQSTS